MLKIWLPNSNKRMKIFGCRFAQPCVLLFYYNNKFFIYYFLIGHKLSLLVHISFLLLLPFKDFMVKKLFFSASAKGSFACLTLHVSRNNAQNGFNISMSLESKISSQIFDFSPKIAGSFQISLHLLISCLLNSHIDDDKLIFICF